MVPESPIYDVIMTGGEDNAIDDFRIKGQTYIWELRLSSN
jgi:hypothetical protein